MSLKPYTAAYWCVRSRHAPLRSITRSPRSNASGTQARETSCGVARNSRSTPRWCSSRQEKGWMGTAVPSTGEMISAFALPLSLSRESSSGGLMRGC